MLAALGMQRNGIAGRVLAGLTCLVSAWIAALTYVAKLFPLYGGYEGRAKCSGPLEVVDRQSRRAAFDRDASSSGSAFCAAGSVPDLARRLKHQCC